MDEAAIQSVALTSDGTATALAHRAGLAAAVAAKHADAVDDKARFPSECFAALREQRLLGTQVPVDLGGDGASVSDVVDVCYALAQACASSAMIFAMHQIMVRILVRHAVAGRWHRQLLRRVAADQLLLASSTTENQTGGDVRSSSCSVARDGGRITLEKNATVMSYGAEADGVLTTARRSADSPPSDQVLVALLQNDYELEHIVDWDVLGMRGTCSSGFTLRANGLAEQIVPAPYDAIHAETMVPVAHLTWSAVWTGIAAGAVGRAQRFVRNAARRAGQNPPGAAHLARAAMSLRSLRGSVAAALHRYEQAASEPGALGTVDFQTSMNLLKVNSSEVAIATVLSAMQACGLSGYRNEGEFSICRS